MINSDLYLPVLLLVNGLIAHRLGCGHWTDQTRQISDALHVLLAFFGLVLIGLGMAYLVLFTFATAGGKWGGWIAAILACWLMNSLEFGDSDDDSDL